MSAIVTAWDNDEQTIFRAEFTPGWTWEDYHYLLDGLKDSVGDRDEEIHWIVIYQPGARMPAGTPNPHHRRSTKVLQLGVTVSVTQDPLVMASVRQSQRMLGRQENIHFSFRKTVEEAREFIDRQKNDPRRTASTSK